MVLSGADIIVRTLIEQGVDTVFGYPGGQIIDVYDSFYKYQSEIKHILTAHEQGAVHAADGYSRTSGKVGVVISTSGPGATNLVTGIATAHLDSVPLVAICGNVPTYQLGTDGFQEIDITGITLPITKHNYVVDSVEKLAEIIREAFCIAKSGRPGPVLIDVPKDIQTAKCEYTPQPAVCPQERYACEDVSDAIKCLKSAKRPFIYFGGGAIISGAESQILQLAELIDAPVGCSLMGISGAPSDHPRFLGMQGMHGRYASSMAMANADCILALGVRFSDRATGDASKFAASAKIIHIDVDSAEFSKNIFPAFELKGDVKLTLEKIISALKKKKRTDWMSQVSKYKEYENACSDIREGLTPYNALNTLNAFLGEDTPVVTDVGQHQMWSAQMVRFSKTRRFVTSGGLGTMGFGIGAAMGAYYGTGQRTVLITGDGSFGMSLNEVATAVTNRIPIVILMMNNSVLGMVRQWQTFFYDKHYSGTILDRKTDFVSLMRAFGADGVCVNNLGELDCAYKKAFLYDGPFLIDCRIDKDELVLPMMPPGGTAKEIIVKVGE